MKYRVSKKQCQNQIDTRWNVCDYCWRKIKPLKTVDNSWNPTYWEWCTHGNKDWWWVFTCWVPIWIFETARNLVLDDSMEFWIKSWSNFKYQFECAISKACDIIQIIGRMEKYKNPRYNKKTIEDYFNKYKKTWKLN